jgi:hypothetical protein
MTGQRHNGIGAHRDVPTPSQMCNEPGPPTVLAPDACAHDPNDRAVELEIDLRVGWIFYG